MTRHRKLTVQNFNPPKKCGGKYCYRSRHEAEQVIEEKAILQPDLELSSYYCHICREWHLTRQKAS